MMVGICGNAIKILGFFLLYIGFSTFSSSPAIGDKLFATIEGTVVAVDENSVMMVTDLTAKHLFGDKVFIKQWAVDAPPEALEFLVLRRRIKCNIVYKTDKYRVGDCRVIYDSTDKEADFSHRVGQRTIWDIKSFIVKYKLGLRKCSEEDFDQPPLTVGSVGGAAYYTCQEGETPPN